MKNNKRMYRIYTNIQGNDGCPEAGPMALVVAKSEVQAMNFVEKMAIRQFGEKFLSCAVYYDDLDPAPERDADEIVEIE